MKNLVEKVIIYLPFKDGQTAHSISRAFELLGMEVVRLDCRVYPEKLFEIYKEFKPDIVFVSRESGILAHLLKCKVYNSDCKFICWNVDTRDSISCFGRYFDLFEFVDIFYVKCRGLIQQYKKTLKQQNIKFLPQGIDPLSYNIERVSNPKSKDVIFIGHQNNIYKTPTGGRIGLIKYLKSQTDFSLTTRCYYDGAKIWDVEHSKEHIKHKIGLGHTGFSHIDMSSSVRDFKIVGSGTFLLTEFVPGLDELFDLEKHVATYKSKDECASKIRYYLKHDTERNRMAETAYFHCHKYHTYIERMRQVISDVELLL